MTAVFRYPSVLFVACAVHPACSETVTDLPVDPLEGFSAACTGRPYSCTLHTPKVFQLTETFSKSSCWAALAFMSATSALTWGKASA